MKRDEFLRHRSLFIGNVPTMILMQMQLMTPVFEYENVLNVYIIIHGMFFVSKPFHIKYPKCAGSLPRGYQKYHERMIDYLNGTISDYNYKPSPTAIPLLKDLMKLHIPNHQTRTVLEFIDYIFTAMTGTAPIQKQFGSDLQLTTMNCDNVITPLKDLQLDIVKIIYPPNIFRDASPFFNSEFTTKLQISRDAPCIDYLDLRKQLASNSYQLQ
jgi:hypothetical protein